MICLRCFVFSLPPCLFHRSPVPKVGFMEHQRSTIHDRHIRKIVFCIDKNVPLYCVHYLHQQKLWYVCDTSSPPVMRSPIFPQGATNRCCCCCICSYATDKHGEIFDSVHAASTNQWHWNIYAGFSGAQQYQNAWSVSKTKLWWQPRCAIDLKLYNWFLQY